MADEPSRSLAASIARIFLPDRRGLARLAALAAGVAVAATLHAVVLRPGASLGPLEFLDLEEFERLIASRAAVLLSIDDRFPFEEHHIEGSECLDAALTPALRERIGPLGQVAVYSSCCAGRTAARIRQLQRELAGASARIRVLRGGLAAWHMSGRPVIGRNPSSVLAKAGYTTLEQVLKYEPFFVMQQYERQAIQEALDRARTPEERAGRQRELEEFDRRSAEEAARMKGVAR